MLFRALTGCMISAYTLLICFQSDIILDHAGGGGAGGMAERKGTNALSIVCAICKAGELDDVGKRRLWLAATQASSNR